MEVQRPKDNIMMNDLISSSSFLSQPMPEKIVPNEPYFLSIFSRR